MNVPLRLVVDDAVVRQSYDEQIKTGAKPSFERFLAEWVDGIVDELCDQRHFSWRIERKEET